MAINFPIATTIGQTHTVGSNTYVWTGVKWTLDVTLTTQPADSPTYNRIINSGFDIWQRGTSFTSTYSYTADRWILVTSGSAATVNQVAFSVGEKLGKNNPAFHPRVVATGQDGVFFANRIEGVSTYAGETITVLGWVRRASGSGNVILYSTQNYGTGGTPSSVVVVGSQVITLTTVWQPFAVTLVVPSTTGKTKGTDGNDFIEMVFRVSGGALGTQTMSLDVWGVHIRPGVHTTDAVDDYHAPEYGPELARCQRYYQAGTIYGMGYGTSGANVRCVAERFPVVMRTSPTITMSGLVYSNSSAFTVQFPTPRGFGGFVTVTATGLFASDGYYAASAEL